MSIVSGSAPMTLVLEIAVGFLVLICMYLINIINRTKKYGYLTMLMGECVQKGVPLGLLVDKSGQVIPFAIERDEKNRGLIKHNSLTLIHPDMALASVTRMRIKNGPEMVLYPMPYFFPFSVHSASALAQVAEKIRHNPDFNWMDSELRIIELLFNGTSTFERDAEMVIREAVVNGYPVPESWFEDEEEEEELTEDIEIVDDEEEEEESQMRDE